MNLLLTIVQIVGGIVSGSLALIADALHNFSDAISLIIAFVARRVARRPSDARMTFGYARIEVVAALVNYTTLIAIGLYLVAEAVSRFFDPQPVDGWLIVWIAAIALVVDLVTAALTWRLSKESINVRAAFLHNIADALGSVAVIVAGTLIMLHGWYIVDPIATLAIAAYILWHAFSEVPVVIRILMLGSPPELPVSAVIDRMQAEEGVVEVHHAHLWQMDERRNAIDAHLVIADGAWDRADAIKARVRRVLEEAFGICHSTLEIECSRHRCGDASALGHRESGAPPDHAH